MVLTVNTNIASLNAQRHLTEVTRLLGMDYQRLASGLRIVSAADDPAGLAISERMRARLRSLSRAQLNANDGFSLAQTAEGALNEVSSMLIRMRELGIQAANGTLTGTDMDSLQSEFSQLRDEIDRISEYVEFNGMKLLNAVQSIAFQVGDGTSPGVDTITLNLPDMSALALGLTGESIGSGGDVTSAIQAVDGAIDTVTGARGELGGFMNRITHAINYIGVEIEHLAAAESRIRDADIAREVASATRHAIIQRMAVSVLQHANMQPKLLLQLLR
jgi:flagellin